jgi:hypothetical protein
MELNENALFAKSYLDIDLGLLSFLSLLIHASNKRITRLKVTQNLYHDKSEIRIPYIIDQDSW